MGLDKYVFSITVTVAVIEMVILYFSLNKKKIRLSRIKNNVSLMAVFATAIVTLAVSAYIMGVLDVRLTLVITGMVLLTVGTNIEILHNSMAKLEYFINTNDFIFVPKYQQSHDKWVGILKSKLEANKEIDAVCLLFSDLKKDVAIEATIFIEYNSLGWITKLYCAEVEESGQD
ncbi:MAG: hypothetical protein IKC10_05795 [Alphaproteobacteria bacterium]|nr:hypothetical protein [Alphaproteobacteria bacterium]